METNTYSLIVINGTTDLSSLFDVHPFQRKVLFHFLCILTVLFTRTKILITILVMNANIIPFPKIIPRAQTNFTPLPSSSPRSPSDRARPRVLTSPSPQVLTGSGAAVATTSTSACGCHSSSWITCRWTCPCTELC